MSKAQQTEDVIRGYNKLELLQKFRILLRFTMKNYILLKKKN